MKVRFSRIDMAADNDTTVQNIINWDKDLEIKYSARNHYTIDEAEKIKKAVYLSSKFSKRELIAQLVNGGLKSIERKNDKNELETIYFQRKWSISKHCELGMILKDDPDYISFFTEPCRILISEVNIIPKNKVIYNEKFSAYYVDDST